MNIDLIGLIVLVVIFFFVTYRFGKSFLTAFIIAFYPAYFLFDLVKTKTSSKEPMVIIGLFVICFLLVLYILRRNIYSGFSMSGTKRLVDSLLLSVGAISQCAFVYYYTLPQLGSLYSLSSTIGNFFNGTIPYVALALAPFIVLLVSTRE